MPLAIKLKARTVIGRGDCCVTPGVRCGREFEKLVGRYRLVQAGSG